MGERLKREIFFTFTISSYVVLLYLFFTAYIHPSKTFTIAINTYGEANIELIMYIFSIPFVISEARKYVARLKEV